MTHEEAAGQDTWGSETPMTQEEMDTLSGSRPGRLPWQRKESDLRGALAGSVLHEDDTVSPIGQDLEDSGLHDAAAAAGSESTWPPHLPSRPLEDVIQEWVLDGRLPADWQEGPPTEPDDGSDNMPDEQVDLIDAWAGLNDQMLDAINTHGDDHKTAHRMWEALTAIQHWIEQFNDPARASDPLTLNTEEAGNSPFTL